MAQPTSSLTRFVGPLYIDSTPPTAAIIGKPLEEGMVYLDTEGGVEGADTSLCVYNGSAWDCIALTAAQPTTTSTTTTAT